MSAVRLPADCLRQADLREGDSNEQAALHLDRQERAPSWPLRPPTPIRSRAHEDRPAAHSDWFCQR